MTKPYIILASQSPRRSTLLRKHGYRFEVIPSQADEKDAQHDDIHDIVCENARIKGGEVARRLQAEGRIFDEPTLILAADTLVVMGQTVYSKPRDLAEATRFLKELGGKAHQVLTGVYLHNLTTGESQTFYDTTHVTLKVLSDEAIQALFQRVTPLDKAAGYGFQAAPEIVADLQGSETNVIGLPMEALAGRL